ncbi:hypothetical protein pdam_00019420 [Pocillopora damicornis]|uniref:Uncharacterized protein n=1 Tax=Pocillopora damicornis TaxID=46731 RepID=A0A3M6V2W2_POCDA|nr:hypothetical protein pdam_00019420 [Pocillopora damicornis]
MFQSLFGSLLNNLYRYANENVSLKYTPGRKYRYDSNPLSNVDSCAVTDVTANKAVNFDHCGIDEEGSVPDMQSDYAISVPDIITTLTHNQELSLQEARDAVFQTSNHNGIIANQVCVRSIMIGMFIFALQAVFGAMCRLIVALLVVAEGAMLEDVLQTNISISAFFFFWFPMTSKETLVHHWERILLTYLPLTQEVSSIKDWSFRVM